MAQRKRIRRPKQKTEESETTPPVSQESQPSDLLRTAQAWGDVVRGARERNETGEQAERELARRRNTSGQ